MKVLNCSDSLFLPIIAIVCWMILLELFVSISSIGTAPTSFWRMICPLAMRTWCKLFTCRRFCILGGRIISLFLFFFHPFSTLSNNVTWFFTIMEHDFGLFGVLLVVICGYGCHCRYCQLPSFSKPLSSNSPSRCATIWSYVPFSR